MKHLYISCCCMLVITCCAAQDSIAVKQLEEVVVTVSRSPQKADSIPVPVTILYGKDIRAMGFRRLTDVLREQTGINFVTDAHGTGLQMQGLDPAYTMILVDGQPLIGRITGKLDLDRITVGTIERVEIIKGASSSLYGSEALAGVVNIITTPAGKDTSLEVAARGGSYGMKDGEATGNYAFAGGKAGVQLMTSYYHTNGYTLPGQDGQTLPPYNSYMIQGKFRYDAHPGSSLELSGRYANRDQHTNYNFNDPQNDATGEQDANWMATWKHTFSSAWNTKLQYYGTRYATREKITSLNTGKETDTSYFRQGLQRLEWQHDYNWRSGLTTTAGIGGQLESVSAYLYPGKQSMHSGWIYWQQQWDPGRRWNILGGFREDIHNVYGSLLSPKLAVQYYASKKISFKASLGRGFKAPVFDQLYLRFTNPLVGYTVLGTQQVKAGALQQMQEAGLITTIYPAAQQAARDLQAEKSWSYNAGVRYMPLPALRIEVNGFNNAIHNLIQSIPIAEKNNGWFVYSYTNVARVYTRGLEASAGWHFGRNWETKLGYQLLYAKDQAVIDSIKTGTGSYATLLDPSTGRQQRATTQDYFGLPQRSRHQLNAKLFFRDPRKGWMFSARANAFSRSGFTDANGNGYIDRYDPFAPGYCIVSLSAEKRLPGNHWTVQTAVENLANFTSPLIAGQTGRQFIAGVRWNWEAGRSK